MGRVLAAAAALCALAVADARLQHAVCPANVNGLFLLRTTHELHEAGGRHESSRVLIRPMPAVELDVVGKSGARVECPFVLHAEGIESGDAATAALCEDGRGAEPTVYLYASERALWEPTVGEETEDALGAVHGVVGMLHSLAASPRCVDPARRGHSWSREHDDAHTGARGGFTAHRTAPGHRVRTRGAMKAHFAPSSSHVCDDDEVRRSDPSHWLRFAHRVEFEHELSVSMGADLHGAWAEAPLHSLRDVTILRMRATATLRPLCHAWHHVSRAGEAGGAMRDALARTLAAESPPSVFAAPEGLAAVDLGAAGAAFLQLQASTFRSSAGSKSSGEEAKGVADAITSITGEDSMDPVDLPDPVGGDGVKRIQAELDDPDNPEEKTVVARSLNLPRALGLVHQGTLSASDAAAALTRLETIYGATGEAASALTRGSELLAAIKAAAAKGGNKPTPDAVNEVCTQVAEFVDLFVDAASYAASFRELGDACEDSRALDVSTFGAFARIGFASKAAEARDVEGVGSLRYGMIVDSSDTATGLDVASCAVKDGVTDLLSDTHWESLLEFAGGMAVDVDAITVGSCKMHATANPALLAAAASADFPDLDTPAAAMSELEGAIEDVIEAATAFKTLRSFVAKQTSIDRADLATIVDGVVELGRLGASAVSKGSVLVQMAHRVEEHTEAIEVANAPLSDSARTDFVTELLTFFLPASAGFASLVDDARCATGLATAYSGDSDAATMLLDNPEPTAPALPGVTALEAKQREDLRKGGAADAVESDANAAQNLPDTSDLVEAGEGITSEPESLVQRTVASFNAIDGILSALAADTRSDLQATATDLGKTLYTLSVALTDLHTALTQTWAGLCADCAELEPLCSATPDLTTVEAITSKPTSYVEPVSKCLGRKGAGWRTAVAGPLTDVRESIDEAAAAAKEVKAAVKEGAKALPAALQKTLSTLSITLFEAEWSKDLGSRRTAAVSLEAEFELHTDPPGKGDDDEAASFLETGEGVGAAPLPTAHVWDDADDALWVHPKRAAREAGAQAAFDDAAREEHAARVDRYGGHPVMHPDVAALLQTEMQEGMSLSDLPRVSATAKFEASASVFSRDVEMMSVNMAPYVDATGLHKALPVLKLLGIEIDKGALTDPKALLAKAGEALLKKAAEVAASPRLVIFVLEKLSSLIKSKPDSLPIVSWIANANDLRDGVGTALYDQIVSELQTNTSVASPPKGAGTCNTTASVEEQAASPACGVTIIGTVLPIAEFLTELHDAALTAAEEGVAECGAGVDTLVAILRVLTDLIDAIGVLGNVFARGATPPGTSVSRILEEAAEDPAHWIARMRIIAYDTENGPANILDALSTAKGGVDDDPVGLTACSNAVLASGSDAERDAVSTTINAVEGVVAGLALVASSVDTLQSALSSGDAASLMALAGKIAPPAWLQDLTDGRNELGRGLLAMRRAQTQAAAGGQATKLRGGGSGAAVVASATKLLAAPSLARATTRTDALLSKMDVGVVMGRAAFGCVVGVAATVVDGIRAVVKASDAEEQLKAVRATSKALSGMNACTMPTTGPMAKVIASFGHNASAPGAPPSITNCASPLCKTLRSLNGLRSGLQVAVRLVERGLLVRDAVVAVQQAVKGEGDSKEAASTLDEGIGAVRSSVDEFAAFLTTSLAVPGSAPIMRALTVVSKALAFVRAVAATVITAVRNIVAGEAPLSPANIATLAVRLFATTLGSGLEDAGIVQKAGAAAIGSTVLGSSNRFMPLGALTTPQPTEMGVSMSVFDAILLHEMHILSPCVLAVCYAAGEINEYEDVAADAGATEEQKIALAGLCRTMQRVERVTNNVLATGAVFSQSLRAEDGGNMEVPYYVSESRGAEAALNDLRATLEVEDLEATVSALLTGPKLEAIFTRFDEEIPDYLLEERRVDLGLEDDTEEEGDGGTALAADEGQTTALLQTAERDLTTNQSTTDQATANQTADTSPADGLQAAFALADLSGLYVETDLPRKSVQPCAPCIKHVFTKATKAVELADALEALLGAAAATEKFVRSPQHLTEVGWVRPHAQALAFLSTTEASLRAFPAAQSGYKDTIEGKLAQQSTSALKRTRDNLNAGLDLTRCALKVAGVADGVLDAFAESLQSSVTDISKLQSQLEPLATKIKTALKVATTGKCWKVLSYPPVTDGPSLAPFRGVAKTAEGTLTFMGTTTSFISSVAGVVDSLQKVKSAQEGAAVLYRFWAASFPDLKDAMLSLRETLTTLGLKSSAVATAVESGAAVLAKFDVQVKRVATAATVVTSPKDGLEQVLTEGIKTPGLEIVDIIAGGDQVGVSMGKVLAGFFRAKPYPLVSAAMGDSATISAATAFDAKGKAAMGLLRKDSFLTFALRLAVASVQGPFERYGHSSPADIPAFVNQLMQLPGAKALAGKERDMLLSFVDLSRGVDSSFLNTLPTTRQVFNVLEQISAVAKTGSTEPDDAELASAIAGLAQARKLGDVLRERLSISTMASERALNLRVALGNMEPPALSLLAISLNLPAAATADDVVAAIAEPMEAGLRLVDAAIEFVTRIGVMLRGVDDQNVEAFSKSAATLSEIIASQVPAMVRAMVLRPAVYFGFCDGEVSVATERMCPLAGSVGGKAAHALATKDAAAFQAFVDDAAARTAHALSALGLAADCSVGLGLRAADVVGSVVPRIAYAVNLDAMVAELHSLNDEADALFAGHCSDAFEDQVPTWLTAAGAITEGAAVAETSAHSAVKDMAGFMVDSARTALAGAAFVEQVKVARSSGATSRARDAIEKAWDALSREGRVSMTCGKANPHLASLVTPRDLPFVDHYRKSLCFALSTGKPIVMTLANVAASSDMDAKTLLLSQLGTKAVDGAIERLVSPGVVMASVLPRIFTTLLSSVNSPFKLVQELVVPTGKVGVGTVVPFASKLYINKALLAARKIHDPDAEEFFRDITDLPMLIGIASGASVWKAMAVQAGRSIAGSDGDDKDQADETAGAVAKRVSATLATSLGEVMDARRAIVDLAKRFESVDAATLDKVAAAVNPRQLTARGLPAPTGAILNEIAGYNLRVGAAVADTSVPLIRIIDAMVSGDPFAAAAVFAGPAAAETLAGAERPTPEELRASLAESQLATFVAGAEKLAVIAQEFVALNGEAPVAGLPTVQIVAKGYCKTCAAVAKGLTFDATPIPGKRLSQAAGGSGGSDGVAFAFEPLLQAIDQMPPLRAAVGEHPKDLKAAANAILYAQEAAVNALSMSASMVAAITPDELTEYDHDAADAADAEAAKKDAKKNDDAGADVATTLSTLATEFQKHAQTIREMRVLVPNLVNAQARMVMALDSTSTAETPAKATKALNGTMQSFAATPAIAEAALDLAAEVLVSVGGFKDAVESDHPMRDVTELLEEWDRKIPALTLALRQARAPLTGKLAVGVDFLERMVTLMGTLVRFLLRTQLQETRTVIVCKGGGAPLASSLTDDRLFSKQRIPLVSISIGPIPVYGVPVTITLSLLLNLEAGLESGSCRFTFMSGREEQYSAVALRLQAEVAADARVALGTGSFGAGLGFTLAIAGFTLAPQLDVQPATGAATLQLIPYVSTLNGEIYVFANLLLKEFRFTLFRWAGLRYRLPGPCFALRPDSFSTCPARPQIAAAEVGTAALAELFAVDVRPAAVRPPEVMLNVKPAADADSEQPQASDAEGAKKDSNPQETGFIEVAADSEPVDACTLCSMAEGFWGDTVVCSAPVNRLHYVAGLPNVGLMVETALSDAGVVRRLLGSGRRRSDIHAVGLCSEQVVEDTATPLVVGTTKLPSRRLRYSAAIAVQWSSAGKLGTEWHQLSFEAAGGTAEGKVMLTKGAAPPADAKASFERQVAREASIRALSVVAALPKAQAKAAAVSTTASTVAGPLPVDGARAVASRQSIAVDNTTGWTVGAAAAGEVAGSLFVEPEACGKRLASASSALEAALEAASASNDAEEGAASADKKEGATKADADQKPTDEDAAEPAEVAAARAALDAVHAECDEDPSAGGAGQVLSTEAYYAASTRKCYRCNLAYSDYLACPLEGARSQGAVQAAAKAMGEDGEALLISAFGSAENRALVAQRCFRKSYLEGLPPAAAAALSDEERVHRETWSHVLRKDAAAMDDALRVYVCDERVTEDGDYEGWIALQSAETFYLRFRVPADADAGSACETKLYAEGDVEQYRALRDRALPQLVEAVVADAAAVDLARQQCLPKPTVALKGVEKVLSSPRLPSKGPAWIEGGLEFAGSHMTECLRCAVGAGVECADDDEDRGMRVKAVLGRAAPRGDDVEGVRTVNEVLDTVASVALRKLTGKDKGLAGSGLSAAVCGETTWMASEAAPAAPSNARGAARASKGSGKQQPMLLETEAVVVAAASGDGARAGGVKAVRQEFRGDKLNVCDFECQASTVLSYEPCGTSVRLAKEAVPGCIGFKPRDVMTGDPLLPVRQGCQALNPKCNSKTSVFSQAAVDPRGSNTPSKECTFDCYHPAGWSYGSKPTKCGGQVTLSEQDAPGCSSFGRGVAIQKHFKWFSDVSRQCLALGGRCTDAKTVTMAAVTDEPPSGSVKGAGFDKECLFSCIQHNTWSSDKSCAATIALPEAIVPGCHKQQVGAKVSSKAIEQMCKANSASSECDTARGLFLGVASEDTPQYVGGVVCFGKDGHTACAKYTAEYAPVAGMYTDGQARVQAEPLPVAVEGAPSFYYAFDKVIAHAAYGKDADGKFRIEDACPAVPEEED